MERTWVYLYNTQVFWIKNVFLIKYSEHFIYEYCVYIISISLLPLQLFLPTPQIYNLLFNYYRYTHIYSFLVKFLLFVFVFQLMLSLCRSSLGNRCNLLVQLPCSSSEIFSPLLLRYFPWALDIGVVLQKLLYRLGMLWSFSLCILVSCGSLLQEAPFMRSGSYTSLEIFCFFKRTRTCRQKNRSLTWQLFLDPPLGFLPDNWHYPAGMCNPQLWQIQKQAMTVNT